MPGTLTLPLAAGRQFGFSSGDCFAPARFLRRPNLECPANRSRTSNRAFMASAAAAVPAVIDSRRPASLYEVLRVKQNASPREIKSAYRSLAKLYHPDSAVQRSEDDGGDFIQIHNAYETLSDPSARALYDLSLAAAVHGGRRRPFSSCVTLNRSPGFYPTRTWETDQCW